MAPSSAVHPRQIKLNYNSTQLHHGQLGKSNPVNKIVYLVLFAVAIVHMILLIPSEDRPTLKVSSSSVKTDNQNDYYDSSNSGINIINKNNDNHGSAPAGSLRLDSTEQKEAVKSVGLTRDYKTDEEDDDHNDDDDEEEEEEGEENDDDDGNNDDDNDDENEDDDDDEGNKEDDDENDGDDDDKEEKGSR